MLYYRYQLSNLNDYKKKLNESTEILTLKVQQTKVNQPEHTGQGHIIL